MAIKLQANNISVDTKIVQTTGCFIELLADMNNQRDVASNLWKDPEQPEKEVKTTILIKWDVSSTKRLKDLDVFSKRLQPYLRYPLSMQGDLNAIYDHIEQEYVNSLIAATAGNKNWTQDQFTFVTAEGEPLP